MATKDERRAQAIKRLEAKKDFKTHATAYVIVNAFLVGLWAVTNAGNYFWPIWPILGWGLGLAFHAWDTFGARPISEADIQREMDKEPDR